MTYHPITLQNRKRVPLTLLFFFSLFSLFAQVPAGYYGQAAGKKGQALYVALHKIIKEHDAQTYSALWNHFYDTDKKENGKVWDIYSDIPNGTPPYEYTFGTNQCGNYAKEGDCYNREHSMPKSWFNDQYPMYTDLFHLYPTDGYVNGRRSNYPYGEVGKATWTSRNGSKLGTSSYSGYSGTVFEPLDEYKGDFARTYFYMSTCYMDKTLSYEEGSAMFSGAKLKTWAVAMLIKWHENDPVSQKEIDRNNAIYKIQNNRNPFIDYPELVGKIFGADSINTFNPPLLDTVFVTGIILNKESVTLCAGATEQLTATVLPTNATNKNVSWSSNDPSIATVSNGLITAVSEGTAIITVTTEDGGFTAQCTISGTVGIDDFRLTILDLQVYPNPTSGQLIINNEQLTINNVDIYDVLGRNLQSKIENRKSKIEIDISPLPAGIYFLKIDLEKGIEVHKIIKQ